MQRYNSTIALKKRQLACGCFDFAFSKNRCKRCAAREYANRISKTNSVNKQDDNLEAWFAYRIAHCKPVCENCGATALWINKEPYLKLFRSAQAHILPKRHFKSISTHPLNGLVLFAGYSGVCSCHDTYDQSWLSASKMNVWPEVCRRFKILYPLIAPKEYQFISDILLDTA